MSPSVKQSSKEKAIIVGGGIIGLSVAFALVENNISVTVIDDRGPRASDYAAGIILPNGTNRASGALGQLNRHAFDLWSGWQEEIGSELLRSYGLLQLADSKEERRVKEWITLLHDLGIGADWFDEQEARDKSPGLNQECDLVGGAWVPEGGSVDPGEAVSALRLRLAEKGVVFQSSKAEEVITVNDRAIAVRVAGVELAADYIIACGGYSDTSWLPEGCRPRLIAQMGERAVIGLPEPLDDSPIIGTPGGSLVPRKTAELWAGVTARDDHSDHQLTVGGGAHVLSNAVNYFSNLAEYPVLSLSAGLRPLSADGLPFVGATPIAGLLLATGHGRDGILQSPAAASAIAELVESGELPEWSLLTDPRGRTI